VMGGEGAPGEQFGRGALTLGMKLGSGPQRASQSWTPGAS
jgi:hypothetical protein